MNFEKARQLLRDFKGEAYLNGVDVLDRIGPAAARWGRRAVFVQDRFPNSETYLETIRQSLTEAGIEIVLECQGAQPNAPREDLARITACLKSADPDVIVSFGGGSTLDAVKAAEVLRTLGGEIDAYFGTGLVTQALAERGLRLSPHVAVQTAASSAAHLTKYSNITEVQTGQKKLIVDEAIIPVQPVFDYAVTLKAPPDLTADGALDGLAHALEVLYGAVGKPHYPQVETVARECIRLVVNHLPAVLENPADLQGRQALGLATDLGGYAIMLGGTNGGHLTSFSLVDVLSHGRACAILNPYYTVFFAPAIQPALKTIARVFIEAGLAAPEVAARQGRALGLGVAEAMLAFSEQIGFPTTLGQVAGFTDAHIERALAAAKNPQLKMKLENMPVPLKAEMVAACMGPVLQAAKTGDLTLIQNV